MYKYIVNLLLIFLMSCSSIKNIDETGTLESFKDSKYKFINIIKQNKINEIEEFFIKGIRNNIILKEIKKYDLSNFLFIIPDKSIDIIEYNKIRTDLLVNFGIETHYFDVIWKKEDNIWKIYSIYEKL